jgi:hypothetical protein
LAPVLLRAVGMVSMRDPTSVAAPRRVEIEARTEPTKRD